MLEIKWVLRSRYKFDRASMTAAVIAMLETPGIEFEQAPTVEEALYLFKQVPPADFEDCLLVARATRLGRDRFLIFDAGAAKLPRAEWVQRFRKGAHRGGHGAGAMPICSRRPVPGGEFTHSTGRFASLAAVSSRGRWSAVRPLADMQQSASDSASLTDSAWSPLDRRRA